MNCDDHKKIFRRLILVKSCDKNTSANYFQKNKSLIQDVRILLLAIVAMIAVDTRSYKQNNLWRTDNLLLIHPAIAAQQVHHLSCNKISSLAQLKIRFSGRLVDFEKKARYFLE